MADMMVAMSDEYSAAKSVESLVERLDIGGAESMAAWSAGR